MHEIKSFQSFQTARVIAVLYAITFAIFMALVFFLNLEPKRPPVIALLLLPIFAGIVVFIAIAFYCWLYNQVARFIGGIAFELLPRNDN